MGSSDRINVSSELRKSITESESWLVDVLTRLIGARTDADEEQGQRIMEAELNSLGLITQSIYMESDKIRNAPGTSPFDWDVSNERNVIGTWSPKGSVEGQSLILNGHIDVVPAEAGKFLWSRDPFSAYREGDWLYGRGAADMKGGLVANLLAVKALRECGYAPGNTLMVESVVEEERSGNGTYMCRIAGITADAALIPEPLSTNIVTDQLGILWFRVHVTGRPAHAKEARDLGLNAIDAIAEITAALRELEEELNEPGVRPDAYDEYRHPINLNPGIIQGGDWASTVAAECFCDYRLATFPGTSLDTLRKKIECAVQKVASVNGFLQANPPVVTYNGLAAEGVSVPADSAIVTTLARTAAEVTGRQCSTSAVTAASDIRAFVECGIPAVCMGPVGMDLHGIDERVSISSIMDISHIFALTAFDWCAFS